MWCVSIQSPPNNVIHLNQAQFYVALCLASVKITNVPFAQSCTSGQITYSPKLKSDYRHIISNNVTKFLEDLINLKLETQTQCRRRVVNPSRQCNWYQSHPTDFRSPPLTQSHSGNLIFFLVLRWQLILVRKALHHVAVMALLSYGR